jgi:hypothetical protein
MHIIPQGLEIIVIRLNHGVQLFFFLSHSGAYVFQWLRLVSWTSNRKRSWLLVRPPTISHEHTGRLYDILLRSVRSSPSLDDDFRLDVKPFALPLSVRDITKIMIRCDRIRNGANTIKQQKTRNTLIIFFRCRYLSNYAASISINPLNATLDKRTFGLYPSDGPGFDGRRKILKRRK